uniref:Uncharacterized protein n=1 Tax=Ammonifex degensii TaxID=42838 RepID=A0A7C1JJE9_9THEO
MPPGGAAAARKPYCVKATGAAASGSGPVGRTFVREIKEWGDFMRFSKSKLKKLRKKRAKRMRMTEQDRKNAMNLEAHQLAVKLRGHTMRFWP